MLRVTRCLSGRKGGHPVRDSHRDSLKRSRLTISQGMLKKGNVVNDVDYDDEVKISASKKNCATASAKEFFLRTQYL
jgi:hypothetical protein